MDFNEGDSVCYIRDGETDPKKYENGVIKTLHPDGDKAWVVYNCGGEWHKYKEYTGALTNFSNLKPGWTNN